jgi:DNA repair protein RadC
VFETVLRHGGIRFIAGHNHPSARLEPSPEDLDFTKMLLDGCKVMELEMLDHLIVSRDRFSSIRQSSALWN